MTTPLTHRVWKIGTVALLLIISVHLTLNGFFKPRTMLTDHSQMAQKHAKSGKKVIFMLFDAMREDFLEWPEDASLYLSDKASYSYKGKKITLFKDLVE